MNKSNLAMNKLTRYSQQIKMEEIGLDGQEKLKNSRVLCIGLGGLGSPLLLYLAA
ncbi:TPA: ThiF family adenylyltransferase, partial [Legionella pneumophila]